MNTITTPGDNAAGGSDNEGSRSSVARIDTSGKSRDSGPSDIDSDDDNNDDSEQLTEENMKKLFVDLSDLMECLQCPGKRSTKKSKTGEPSYTYPLLVSLGAKYYERFKSSKLIPLTANASRDKTSIVIAIVGMRKHVDVCNVNPKLLQHIPNTNVEKVYIMGNDDLGGQRVLINNCYAFFHSRVVKNDSKRSGDVAIRLAHCLCHPSVREAASYWLANKKIRADLDQASGETRRGFGELLQSLYTDTSLEIDRPEVMNLSNHDPEHKINPHAVDKDKSVEWILDVWDSYLKGRYKKVLVKWYKNTGNGDRTLPNFVNYCNISRGGSGAPLVWMVWVYAIDMKADFLLASAAEKRPPDFIWKEAGFNKNTSTDDASNVDFTNCADGDDMDSLRTPSTTSAKKRRTKLETEFAQRGQKLDKIMTTLTNFVEKKQEAEAKSDPVMDGLAQIDQLNASKQSISVDDDYTPNTKANFLEAIKSRKRKIAKFFLEK